MKRGKCLALVAVLAMVVCAFAVALPAGDSDADPVDATVVANGGTISASGKYYIAQTGTITNSSNDAFTIYVAAGAALTINNESSGTGAVTVKVASAATVSGNTASVTEVEGLSLIAEKNVAYTVDADAKTIATGATSAGDGAVYGLSVAKDSAATVYYPMGANAGQVSLTTMTADKVSIIDGSATINGGKGNVIKDTVKVVGLKSGTAITIAVTETYDGSNAGALTLAGGASDSSATGELDMERGKAVVSSTTTYLTTVLGGFAQESGGTTTIYASIADGATASTQTTAYGNYKSGQTFTGTVNFINADGASISVQDNNAVATFKPTGNMSITNAGVITFDGSKTVSLILVSGTFSTGSASIIASDKVTVQKDATLELPADVALAGEMYVYGILDSTDTTTLSVSGTLKAYTGSRITSKVTVSASGSGAVDISGAQAVMYVSMSTNQSMTYYQSQIVTVDESWEVYGTATEIVIMGGLNIPAGATMTISSGAKVYVYGDAADVKIDGTLVVDEKSSLFVGKNETLAQKTVKSVAVSGSITSEGALDINANEFVVKSGAIIDSDGVMNATKMTVNAGGFLYLTGNANITGILNAGYVYLDEVKLTGESTSTISLTAADAAVYVNEVQVDASNTLTINDARYESDGKTSVLLKNSVLLAGTKAVTVSGVEVVSSGKYTSSTDDKRTLDISGSVSVESTLTDYALNVTIRGAGMTVKDSLILGKNVAMKYDGTNYGTLAVSGTLVATDGTFTGADNASAVLTVTGLVQSETDLKPTATMSNFKINAVVYKTTGTDASYYYTTLANAIDSESTKITVLGEISMTESDEIPAGMTLEVSGILTVGSTSARDVVLTIDDGAKVTGNITVLGSVYVENVKNASSATIDSDVKVEDGYSATYTNVYTAMSVAEDGDVVTITAEEVELDSSITIGEGVTLSVPTGTKLTIAEKAKVTITVAGTLFTEAAIGNFVKADSSLVITGDFVTGENTSDVSKLYDYYNFGGAYYVVTDSDGTYAHMTSLENSILDEDIENDTVYVYGKATAGSILIIGTEDEQFTISVMSGATLTATTIDLTYGEVVIDDGAKYTGTIESDDGAVTMSLVGGITAVEDEGLTISGTVADAAADTTNSLKIASGTVSVGDLTVSDCDSFSVAESAAMKVTGTLTAANGLTLAGTVAVANSAKINVTGTLEVLGTLTVSEKEKTTSTLGTVSAGDIYVGITADSLGAAASVTAPEGTVTVTTVYIGAGSSVSDAVVKDLKYVSTFYVEGVEKLTIYTSKADLDVPDKDQFAIPGAEIEGWVDADGDDVEHVGDAAKVIAELNYDVYYISIVADYGFADIYMDGAKVATVSGGVVYYVDDTGATSMVTTAGSHTVKYTLKSGYSGDKVTTTFDGKSFTETFTIDKSMDYGEDNAYKLVLSGVTQSEIVIPEQEKKDSTLTDALLIVLVVLIAIMAIMVALRLMRS